MTRATPFTALLLVCVALTGCPQGDTLPDDAAEADTTLTADPPVAGGTAHRGTLAAGDSALASGEFADEVRFTARRGQHVVVDLASTEDLDTYLIVRTPAGVQHENDDAGTSSHSRLVLDADTSGTWRAIATSYEAGQTGPYTLRISVE